MSMLGNNNDYVELNYNNLAQPQQNLMKCNVMWPNDVCMLNVICNRTSLCQVRNKCAYLFFVAIIGKTKMLSTTIVHLHKS
jgi:hypothetical protein